VVVLGSLNMDLVLTATQIPRPGETVLAGSDDHVAQEIRGDLAPTGVRLDHVREIGGVSSGLAVVTVDPQGENAIVVLPGANHHLTPDELARDESAIAGPVIAVAQLETPLDTVRRFAEVAVDNGAQLVLNTAVAALEQLVARDARGAVVTLGSQGCLAQTEEGLFEIASYEVPVVDTTGAGDAFVGAFAAALASQAAPEQALRFAAAAGAVTCRVAGAQQDGLSYGQVQELIREQPGVRVHRVVENVPSQ
jgi:ribokinase